MSQNAQLERICEVVRSRRAEVTTRHRMCSANASARWWVRSRRATRHHASPNAQRERICKVGTRCGGTRVGCATRHTHARTRARAGSSRRGRRRLSLRFRVAPNPTPRARTTRFLAQRVPLPHGVGGVRRPPRRRGGGARGDADRRPLPRRRALQPRLRAERVEGAPRLFPVAARFTTSTARRTCQGGARRSLKSKKKKRKRKRKRKRKNTTKRKRTRTTTKKRKRTTKRKRKHTTASKRKRTTTKKKRKRTTKWEEEEDDEDAQRRRRAVALRGCALSLSRGRWWRIGLGTWKGTLAPNGERAC